MPALVVLVGILSTTQLHLAKALERQGIETLELVRARLRRSGEPLPRGGRKPLVYAAGLALNSTAFLWHLLVGPLGGPAALYTGMFGVGLLALLAYSARVLREPLSRRELAGAIAILAGTSAVGVDGIARPAPDMSQTDVGATLAAAAVLVGIALVLLLGGLRSGSPHAIGLTFGLVAGALGSLDPFLKAVGQTAGGWQGTPGTALGWTAFAASFAVGFAALLVSQWGFYRRARANVLVPAYNCTYIAVPVALQVLALPGYALSAATAAGLGSIMAGFALIRGFGRGRQTGLQD